MCMKLKLFFTYALLVVYIEKMAAHFSNTVDRMA